MVEAKNANISYPGLSIKNQTIKVYAQTVIVQNNCVIMFQIENIIKPIFYIGTSP